jgi:NAD(P)-dependent dehydrogenase (short-subunit alcohol dehydrogenase family)
MSGLGTPAAIDTRPHAAASRYLTNTTTRRGQLKPLAQPIIVITGASSGIGLCTARMAAKRGARLVLNSRNEAALRQLADEINGQGGGAMYQVADVADEAALRVVADLAIARFGGFDTWINNAGVSIYGRMTDVPDADHRRLLDTNFWGVVNGSRIAAEHLRHRGGALINIGSTLSDRAIPGQGMYCASKHAVKGFTDALRMELDEAGAPISVSLVKPAAIDTPYRQHAKNYLPETPDNPPPVYAPEVDTFMEWTMFTLQQTGRPTRTHTEDALSDPQPASGLRERGGHPGHVLESSLDTRASLHPIVTGGSFVVAGLAAVALCWPRAPRTWRRQSAWRIPKWLA